MPQTIASLYTGSIYREETNLCRSKTVEIPAKRAEKTEQQQFERQLELWLQEYPIFSLSEFFEMRVNTWCF